MEAPSLLHMGLQTTKMIQAIKNDFSAIIAQPGKTEHPQPVRHNVSLLPDAGVLALVRHERPGSKFNSGRT